MYNGIGLRTVRGTATNGYVQRNYAAINEKNKSFKQKYSQKLVSAKEKNDFKDEAIIEHNNKRKIEVKLLELRVAMEEKGKSEEEIISKISDLREKIQRKSRKRSSSAESGQVLQEKTSSVEGLNLKAEKFREALRIPKSRKLGESFTEEFEKKKFEEKEARRVQSLNNLEREGKEIPDYLRKSYFNPTPPSTLPPNFRQDYQEIKGEKDQSSENIARSQSRSISLKRRSRRRTGHSKKLLSYSSSRSASESN